FEVVRDLVAELCDSGGCEAEVGVWLLDRPGFVVDGFDPVNLLQRADKCIHRAGAHTQMTVAASEFGEQRVRVAWLLQEEPEQGKHERVVSGAKWHGSTLHSYTTSRIRVR